MTLCLLAGGLTGLLAFVIYYATTSFADHTLFLEFFKKPDDRYFYFSLVAGLIFSTLTFVFHGRRVNADNVDLLRQTVASWALSLLIMLGILFLFKIGLEFSRGVIVVWALLGIPMFFGIRLLERQIAGALSRAGLGKKDIAIVGATEQADRLVKWMATTCRSDELQVIGVFDEQGHNTSEKAGCIETAGDLDNLMCLCQNQSVDAIVLALPGDDPERIRALTEALRPLPADILLGPDLAQLELQTQSHSKLGPLTVVSLAKAPMQDWWGVAKWLEDMVIGLLALAFLLPLLAVIAIAIKIDSPGPILFRQPRFGLNNQKFWIYKFRTMHQAVCDPEGAQATRRDDQRVTRLGRFLRRASLDELPQLINVLRGEMSIVGPRPHPVRMQLGDQLIHHRIQDYASRHKVKPGITGLAQINGNRGEVRSLSKAEQRIRFDLQYIDNWSVWLDFEIILKTAFKLPFDRSAY